MRLKTPRFRLLQRHLQPLQLKRHQPPQPLLPPHHLLQLLNKLPLQKRAKTDPSKTINAVNSAHTIVTTVIVMIVVIATTATTVGTGVIAGVIVMTVTPINAATSEAIAIATKANQWLTTLTPHNRHKRRMWIWPTSL
nr:hypothetical protein CKG001_00590 [Bdellovibrio sp. CKG001]